MNTFTCDRDPACEGEDEKGNPCKSCCDHSDVECGECLDCGSDQSQGRAFMRAEAAAEGDR